jgi:hypothetical protein
MWPDQLNLSSTTVPEEERNVCHLATATTAQLIIPFDRFSTFTKLKRITAWVLRFVKNARPSSTSESCPYLTVTELISAENYWISIVQGECFAEEIELLKTGMPLPKNNRFLPLQPFLDQSLALLRVGG